MESGEGGAASMIGQELVIENRKEKREDRIPETGNRKQGQHNRFPGERGSQLPASIFGLPFFQRFAADAFDLQQVIHVMPGDHAHGVGDGFLAAFFVDVEALPLLS